MQLLPITNLNQVPSGFTGITVRGGRQQPYAVWLSGFILCFHSNETEATDHLNTQIARRRRRP